ncbi:hypothetical protein LX32DRAFT_654400 [Colletotrichum zoysiae]|uniref:Apple domain-containing protein n=1 Tax=Colletotrichum zoysiae TaxID=1216348 RepID=A0AAD9HDG6_9PEZI|nr:hypothetical protein LX32DRAFT_654400 [Colletotrichum zoysiae]
MRYAQLLGVILLYSRRVAARVIQGRNLRPGPQLGESTHPVAARGRSGAHFNGTVNATSSAGTGTEYQHGSSSILVVAADLCKLHKLEGYLEYIFELNHTQFSHHNATSSLPHYYTSSFLGTGGSTGTATSIYFGRNTSSAAPTPTTEPCDDDLSSTPRLNPTSAAFTTQLNSTETWYTSKSTSIAQETPCDNETGGSNVTATLATATSSDPHVNSTTPCALSVKTPNESCVIDTSMVPVTIAPLTSVPTSTVIPTKTVCQEDAPTGKPKPDNNHCGVHGLPVGNYFLARFVENAPGAPVTLEGCYQFCASVMDATNGCKAYRFYPERGINVPRCDLYGSSVAYALDSINNDNPDIWFDLNCGSPSDQRWAHLPGMTRLRKLGLLE